MVLELFNGLFMFLNYLGGKKCRFSRTITSNGAVGPTYCSLFLQGLQVMIFFNNVDFCIIIILMRLNGWRAHIFVAKL